MTIAELIRVYERNLRALGAHFVEVSMEDKDHIRIIRVLIQTAEEFLKEKGETNDALTQAASTLTDFARTLYIKSCLAANPEISDKEDFAEESGEMFDYVYQHGSYPDE